MNVTKMRHQVYRATANSELSEVRRSLLNAELEKTLSDLEKTLHDVGWYAFLNRLSSMDSARRGPE